MADDTIRGVLPPVIQPLVSDFFDKPKVKETRATCHECAMCNHGQASPVPMDYFLDATKCCTYFPQLPNYLVGAILADEGADMAEGKRRVREVIADRKGTLPLSLTRPRKMTFLMSNYADSFGRARSLLCPYYNSESPEYACTIWRHREAVCMTYYCKYEAGQRGYDFWTALKDYLFFVQRVLARAAAAAVDPKVKEPKFKNLQMTPEDMDDAPPKRSDYAAWWGKWVGREEEWYRKTYEWVTKFVPRADFKTNIDDSAEGKKLYDGVVSAYSKLENKVLPATLVKNARMKEQHVGGQVVVTTYHRFDSFALDKELYEVVGLFKPEQTLAENLQRLAKEEGIELAPELIEYLFAAGILVEPTPAVVASATAPPKEALAELRGKRAALRAILDARSITLGPGDSTRIDDADTATLDTWIKRAAVATTFTELLEVG
ncbi:MAG: hypothetical protein KIT84_35365 [Labilithrix sp.]|nr:hypothetical protein [Labilithrix sp.]MCW5816331.1 hypothetical protein [Labilithrix sp.]